MHVKRVINKSNQEITTNAMLKLDNIKKDYIVSGNNEPVHALKGINLCFRKNEFVSILGPSGCGKTTLLNIIGGLDKYSDGNLIIAGKSTKKYSDRDWDIYRNHRIGFIFQSYNLIPHQTILGNVELALTIAGMSKKERREKAKKALDRVGLKGMYNKHPNQLSGGQCQRVAIARALVNEPEILLADEPTGALDTTTSKQIMDLIKEISKEKLVIMVTHNPEIAEEYSNRIIRLLDGLVVTDTNPLKEKKEIKSTSFNVTNEKAKMSWWTAFKLSARNLISKFKRTVLVCIAGSIGIVGVSTVLAISSGVQNYIVSMQDDMLSGNPITITEVAYDLNGLLNEASNLEKAEIVKEHGFVNVNSLIEYLIESSKTMNSYRINNNITQEYIDYITSMPSDDVAAISLDYGLDLSNNIYTNWYYDGSSEAKNMSLSTITKMYTNVLEQTTFKDQASYVSQLSTTFSLAPDNKDYLLSQYDLLEGDVATKKDEIMVVINKDSQLTDILLGQLGYYTQEEFLQFVYKGDNDNRYDSEHDKRKFSYEEIINKEFYWYPNDTVFTKNTSPMLSMFSPFTYNPYKLDSFENGIKLKITGILQPKETISYGCLSSGFYYTADLAKYVLEQNLNSEIVTHYAESLKNSESKNITSGFYPINGSNIASGITFNYEYTYEGVSENVTGFVGNESSMSFLSGMLGGMGGNALQNKYYTISLRELGGNNIASSISIYPTNFECKDNVTAYLDKWNNKGDVTINDKIIKYEDRERITYSDTLELVINLINTMIDMITYALIVFTALSLLVSTVMIGIITYVSVVERVKEIGVIRSLGGRKKDVSYLFIAETFIIGLTSGIFGILITLGLSFIINIIVGHLAGIYTIASLPVSDAIIMIVISVMLTLISGLIPARAAANKNPVEALRTE